jgi:hypothetical protein
LDSTHPYSERPDWAAGWSPFRTLKEKGSQQAIENETEFSYLSYPFFGTSQ